MSARFKPCQFCGGVDLGTRRVQESPNVDGTAVFCAGCSTVVVTRARDEQGAAMEWNTRAELPRPSLPPRKIVGDDRLKPVLFCPVCFASEDSGSWDHVVENGFCSNCGNGSTFALPRWAVESVREQASWVGKRYYPNDEDKDTQRELKTLRAMQTEFPGRSVTRDVDDEGYIHFHVKQVTGLGKYATISFGARSCGSADQAWEEAKTRLPYMNAKQLAGNGVPS